MSPFKNLLRNASYSFSGRPYFRWKHREEEALEASGISSQRIHRGTHSPRLFFSGLFGLPVRPRRWKVSAVHIRRPFGRFGNQLFQILYAVVIAKRLGAQQIIAPGNATFGTQRKVKEIDGIRVQLGGSEVDWEPVGRLPIGFHLKSQVHLTYNTFFADEPSELSEPISSKEYGDAAATIRTLWDVPRFPQLPEDHLVIHLRAGDIFRQNPHPSYGQPPLSFYEKILRLQTWNAATVVREDSTHPLEEALAGLLTTHTRTHAFRSGSLEEDIDYLRSAASLVASRGTFIPAVSLLSNSLRRVYVFGPEGRYPETVRITRILDSTGEYWDSVCSDNWSNSDRQIGLMKTYSLAKLMTEAQKHPMA